MENMTTEKLNFGYFQSLFDRGGFKSPYFVEAQRVFEKHYSLLGLWKLNSTSEKKRYGKINEDGKWSWMNRINTHPNCCLSFYEWAIEENPNMFTDLGNPIYHKYNARKMWEFLDRNFDLFFTKKITTKYYNELKNKCQRSWNNGNISLISTILFLPSAFENITNIDYLFKYGDGGDMDGTDLTFDYLNVKKSIQVKSGYYINLNDDEFLVRGSPNSLKYSTDYYSYVNTNSRCNESSIIIFKNTPYLSKTDDGYIHIKKEFVIYHKIKEMKLSEKLNELLIICSENKINFTLEKEGHVNFIKYTKDPESSVLINLPNIDGGEHDNLIFEIDKIIKSL